MSVVWYGMAYGMAYPFISHVLCIIIIFWLFDAVHLVASSKSMLKTKFSFFITFTT